MMHIFVGQRVYEGGKQGLVYVCVELRCVCVGNIHQGADIDPLNSNSCGMFSAHGPLASRWRGCHPVAVPALSRPVKGWAPVRGIVDLCIRSVPTVTGSTLGDQTH